MLIQCEQNVEKLNAEISDQRLPKVKNKSTFEPPSKNIPAADFIPLNVL